ncbi:MAG TPA: hypothetical protein VJ063_13220 [Verrucomicrobiae bacterium]|nr:hypothetical protein [Verrucomicrobiae bacterium]
MRTETSDQQAAVAVPPSFADLFNAHNPTDTDLVPRNDITKLIPTLPSAASLTSGTHPVVQSSVHPPLSKKPRNGKIARLPKPVRDVVNRMLFNHVPQQKIVAALEEIAINVTQRNISNWKTRGGYREWCLAQEHAIHLHNHQDNLIDLIRRHDGSELPEVGLQAAATQLSQFFLTPAAAQLLASDPKAYDLRISMLARISAQLKGIQKYRDDCAKNLGYHDDPARIRRNTDGELEKLRHDWSSDPGHSPKDPQTPHRNELPKHGELFHLEPPPPTPMFPTFEEWKAAREHKAAKAAADAQSTEPSASPPEESLPVPTVPAGPLCSDTTPQ